MPLRILNEIVDLPLNGEIVKGILKAEAGSWNFQSLNMQFLTLFSSGILHSHTYFDAGTLHCPHHRFQQAVAQLVAEKLAEGEAPAYKPRPRMSQPVYQTHRRIMMP